MNCTYCPNPHNKDMLTLTGKHICIACAVSIANAVPELENRPSRRFEIASAFIDSGVPVSPADKSLGELVDAKVTDFEIKAAILKAKSTCPSAGVRYIVKVIIGERGNNYAPPAVPSIEGQVERKEPWQLEGFRSESDYNDCTYQETMEKFKSPKFDFREFRKQWKQERYK